MLLVAAGLMIRTFLSLQGVALVAAVGLLACFWPARRASRFNPIAL